MKYKILIVEDEPEIIKLIRNRLNSDIFDIAIENDGAKALETIESNYFDLVTLDIMLPHVDGLTLCEEIRKRHKDTLILIVSALESISQKEKAYFLGADDYFSKPFSSKLLALKIESLLKRRTQIANPSLSFSKNLHHDENLRLFFVEGKSLGLTVSEYTVLKILFNTPKKVFSKEELSQILYNDDIGNIDKEGIGTYIYQIRKKISQLTKEPVIKTLWNVGYTLYEC